MTDLQIFHGDIVYSSSPDTLCVFEDSYIVVEGGTVSGIFRTVPEQYSGLRITDYGRRLIIPAFTDMHVHAPQFMQRGTEMDLLLSDWLDRITFPAEARFSDTEYAELVYNAFADQLIKNGTFHSCVFATIHTKSSILLAEILKRRGMHAFVGKVNMDVNSPDYLCETVKSSLHDTEDFLSYFDRDSSVRPILTPRFAPTCSAELLKGLGKLGARYSVGTQTHLVESRWEAAESIRLFPDCSSDAEIYEKAGLLGNGPNVFAHFIFPTDEDIRIAQKYSAVTVHCPEATNNIIAGIMPAKLVCRSGITVASGTDVGAGSRMSVYSQAAAAVRLSKLRDFYQNDGSTLSFPNAFYMATAAGGKVFGSFGSFENGFVFDALVLDGLEDCGIELSAEKRLERFCYNGDDRNIIAGYMAGKKVI